MTCRILFVCAAVALLVPAAPTSGASPVAVARENPSREGATFEYWAAERLRDARPLGVMELFAEATASELDAIDESSTEQASAPGGPPRRGIRPRNQQLFDPTERLFAPPSDGEALGGGGGHFTSQRLVPESADRWYAYSTVGKLFFTIPGLGDFWCSAALIRYRILATAAQCVHKGKNGGFYTNFEFVPAYRDGTVPLGSWDWDTVWIPSAWATTGGTLPHTADYALIELQDSFYNGLVQRAGSVLGFLGYAINKLRPNHATLLGYSSSHDAGEKLHQVSAKDYRTRSPNNVEYGSDMRGGSAGGPIIQDFGDTAAAKWVGCLSTHYSSTATKLQGASIPNSAFTGLLATACAHRPGNC